MAAPAVNLYRKAALLIYCSLVLATTALGELCMLQETNAEKKLVDYVLFNLHTHAGKKKRLHKCMHV